MKSLRLLVVAMAWLLVSAGVVFAESTYPGLLVPHSESEATRFRLNEETPDGCSFLFQDLYKQRVDSAPSIVGRGEVFIKRGENWSHPSGVRLECPASGGAYIFVPNMMTEEEI